MTDPVEGRIGYALGDLLGASGRWGDSHALPGVAALVRRIVGAPGRLRRLRKADLRAISQPCQNAQQEIGRNVLRVAIHDGGNPRARSATQFGNLRVGEREAPHDVDDLVIEGAPLSGGIATATAIASTLW